MAEYADREHFIPLRRSELINALCRDLSAEESDHFRQLCQLVIATYHFEFNRQLEKLKESYAPFDPDRDTQPLTKWRVEERQRHLYDLFSEFGWLMDRANFKHLSREEIEPTIGTSSYWGLRVEVDFHMFERLAIFARGEDVERRMVRRPGKLWVKQEVEVPIYRRLVMILKLRPDQQRLGARVNTDSVYLQVFKNIPKLDINMLLPGARVRMTKVDSGKIGLPFVGGIGMAIWNVADQLLAAVLGTVNPLVFWGLATGASAYGTRCYFSYVGTRQRYNLNLTQVLFFQNLDTNAGVLLRILDEAEEQEGREAILAYYILWRRAGDSGWTSEQLDDAVEQDLEQRCGVKVDFEIGDAIAKLEKLQIVEKNGTHYRARPISKALEMLDAAWNSLLKSKNGSAETKTVLAGTG